MSLGETAFYLGLMTLSLAYAIGLVILSRNPRVSSSRPKDDFYPTVSLVVPTYNEGVVIRRKLDNLLQLDFPREKLEVLVVDSGSTDNTRAIVRSIADGNGDRLKITLIEQPTRTGKSEAINEALKHVRSEVLVLSDADVTFPPEALARLVSNFADPSLGAVSGVEVPVGGDAVWDRLESGYRSVYTAIRIAEANADTPFMCESEFSAYRRNVLQPLRKGCVCDDVELTIGVRSTGARAAYDLSSPFFEKEASTPKSKFLHKLRRGMANQHALLRNTGVLFNKPYGKYGSVVFPFEFFAHILSPILISMSLILFLAVALTTPSSVPFLALATILSALAPLSALRRLVRRNVNARVPHVTGASHWILGTFGFIVFQFALLGGLVLLVLKGPRVNWKQIPETRTAFLSEFNLG